MFEAKIDTGDHLDLSVLNKTRTGFHFCHPETGDRFEGYAQAYRQFNRTTHKTCEAVEVLLTARYVELFVCALCMVYPTRQQNFDAAVSTAVRNKRLLAEHMQNEPKLTEPQIKSLAWAARCGYKWEGHYSARDRFEKEKLIENPNMGVWDLTPTGKVIADWCRKRMNLAVTILETSEDVQRVAS